MFLASIRNLRRFALVPLIAASVGCSTIDSGETVPDDGPVSADQVAFATDQTLELAPSEVVELTLKTTPKGSVTLLLLGDAFDASLDSTTVEADADGRATVTLKASSKPSIFRLRAIAGKAMDELPVAVSELGFAPVQVRPRYEGRRAVTSWRASISIGKSCQDVKDIFPTEPEGALTTEVAQGEDPIIGSVPVGPGLSVSVHSGELMFGCIETTLTEPNIESKLEVLVSNLPMNLGEATLELELGLAPEQSAYSTLVTSGAKRVRDLAFPQGALSLTLLDAIAANLDPSASSELDTLRAQTQLESLLATHLATAQHDPYLLLATLAAELDTTLTPNLALAGVVTGNTADSSRATLSLDHVGAITAADLGADGIVPITWNADATDTVFLGATLPVPMTRYSGSLLSSLALSQNPSLTSMPEVIAAGVDCSTVASMVGPLSACDLYCVEDACHLAIEDRWEIGKAGLSSDVGQLSLSATGPATVDGEAVPTSIEGSYAGTLEVFSSVTQLEGTFTANSVAPPN